MTFLTVVVRMGSSSHWISGDGHLKGATAAAWLCFNRDVML